MIAGNRFFPDSGTEYLAVAKQSTGVFIEEGVKIAGKLETSTPGKQVTRRHLVVI